MLGGNTKLDIPITFKAINSVFMYVEQEQWNYLNGNEKETSFKDCFSWKKVSKLVEACENICLPVNMQYIWEENIDRPKCQNGFDHICMMKFYFNVVRKIISPFQYISYV